MVKDARKKGLTCPVLFMGYYNPFLSFGEERLLKECQEAGVNGFIVVDLPPEEAVAFRKFCAKGGCNRDRKVLHGHPFASSSENINKNKVSHSVTFDILQESNSGV